MQWWTITSSIATIFIPLGFVASMYGTNFKYMPELGWHWGYPVAVTSMVAVGLFMLIYFRKKKWV